MKTENIILQLEAKHSGETEYLQAVHEVLLSIEDVYNQHPEFAQVKLIERLVEPDRIITFHGLTTKVKYTSIWAIVYNSTTPLVHTKEAYVFTPQLISAF